MDVPQVAPREKQSAVSDDFLDKLNILSSKASFVCSFSAIFAATYSPVSFIRHSWIFRKGYNMGSLFVLAKPWQIFACVFFLIFAPQTYASLDAGIAWLKAQQQAGGSFSSDFAFADSSQATAEVLIALHQHKALEELVKTEALAFLSEQSASNLESTVNRLRINKALSASLPVKSFKDYSGYSGGFGDYPGYDDSIYATAQLLASIDNLGALQEVNGSAALGFLLSRQRSDKAWSEEGNSSSIVVTAQVNRALQQHRLTFNLNDKISTSSQYLIKAQASSGGWSNALETAHALLAIIPAASTPSIYEASVQHLMNAQLSNGSWNNDPYTTAMALQVLYILRNPPVVENKELGSIAGTLKSQATGLPIDSARIDIAGPGVRNMASNKDGYFNAPNLPPGEYSIKVTATGYQQVELKVTLGNGAPLDAGTIQLKVLLDSGVINGRVTDDQTGVPLANVDLVLLRLGGGKYLTSTDSGGFYSQEVVPGQYSIGFALESYYTLSKTLYVGKETENEYSPQLHKLSDGFIEEGYLYGTVSDPTAIDGVFGAFNILRGIEGVSVREIVGGASTTTDANGKFRIAAKNGLIKIVFEKDGFETKVLDGVFSGGDDSSAGSVSLTPINGGVFGKVIDAKTGVAVPYASIKAEKVIVTSDALGSYRLSGTKLDKATVIVSAAGYETQSYVVSTPQNDIARYDFSLKKIILSQIDIVNFASSRNSLKAFEVTTFSGTIKNSGEETDEVVVQAQIWAPDGQLVQEIAISDELAGDSHVFAIAPGEIKNIGFEWNTSANKPGAYRIAVNAFSTETKKLLSQKDYVVDVIPTAELAWVKIGANVSSVNQGSTQNITIQGSVKNQSNIPSSIKIDFSMLDPQGNEVLTGKQSVTIDPFDLFAVADLGVFPVDFNLSGTYIININSIEGVNVGNTLSGEISSIPNIKINIEQAITHDGVVLEGNTRVKLKIKIEGSEDN